MAATALNEPGDVQMLGGGCGGRAERKFLQWVGVKDQIILKLEPVLCTFLYS